MRVLYTKDEQGRCFYKDEFIKINDKFKFANNTNVDVVSDEKGAQ